MRKLLKDKISFRDLRIMQKVRHFLEIKIHPWRIMQKVRHFLKINIHPPHLRCTFPSM